MFVNLRIKKVVAVALAAGVGLAVQISAQPVAARAKGQPASITNSRGDPNAVPPILPSVSSSQLAALDAWESVEFSDDPPASGRYSLAEMNAYATERR